MKQIDRRHASKSGLFLMELIIAILFFAFASAICMQVFAKAHIISSKSKDLTMAITKVQSAAEIFKSSNGNVSDLSELLEAKQDGKLLTICYDKEWNPIPNGNGIYRMTIQITNESPISVSNIQMLKENQEEPIYEIEVKKYHPHH